VSIPAKQDHSDDADGGDEQSQPSSPSVKKTEEKGITVVHEVKCKLYVKSSDPADKGWKDKGTGNLYIKCKEGVDKGTKESKPTILVRNDVGKLLLNALLYAGMKTSPQKNALVAIFHSSDDSNENVTPRTFLIRTKNAEARDNLATAIQEYAPSS
jgi:nuclear pore complex protein Nup50